MPTPSSSGLHRLSNRSTTLPASRRRRPWFRRLPALPLLAGLALAWQPLAASAQTLLERPVSSGELVMVGTTDVPPLASLDAKGQPVGYAIEVARRIDAEIRAQTGGKVKLRFVPVANTGAMLEAVASGGAALACGVPFSWEREMVVDYSLPIGLSSLRLLTSNAALDGTPASLAGRRIGVVTGSLGATAIGTLQPAARAVSFDSYALAFAALRQGGLDGLLGDSNVMAGLRRSTNLSAARLLPATPYASYGVGCIVPQNNSDLENIVNLAIARLQTDYLEGKPEAVAAVDPWLGPNGVLGLSSDQIRTFFQMNLINLEPLLSSPPAAARPAP